MRPRLDSDLSEAPTLLSGIQDDEPADFDDSKLRKVSFTTNGVLFDNNFTPNANMLDLLAGLKNRYRIFLVTQVDSENSETHKRAKELL